MTNRVRLQSIPRQYQDGFAKIRDMPAEAVRQLLSALDYAPLLMNPDALAEQIASEVEGISGDDISDIIWSLLSVYSLREELGLSTSDVTEQIGRAMQESRSEKLKLTDKYRTQLEERLVALLSSGRLDLMGKASALTLEQERFMSEARIVTDVRPIFGSDPASRPSGAVIVHTLKLTYKEGDNQRKDFYIAMDAVDLRNLQESIERAEKKVVSTKSMLEAANVPFIDLK